MLRSRILSGTIGIFILIGSLVLGEIPFFLIVTGIGGISLIEFYNILRKNHIHPYRYLGLSSLIFLFFAALLQINIKPIIIFIIFLILVYYLVTSTNFIDAGLTLIGLSYIGLLVHLILLRLSNPHGFSSVLLVFVGTWTFDTTAFFVGKWLGGKKIVPHISPNKTWEGTIAAFVLTSLVLSLPLINPWLSILKRLLLGLMISLAAFLGDLVESKFKREIDIKDSSTLIPGHGGFLDRFDSLLFTGTATYYVLRVIG